MRLQALFCRAALFCAFLCATGCITFGQREDGSPRTAADAAASAAAVAQAAAAALAATSTASAVAGVGQVAQALGNAIGGNVGASLGVVGMLAVAGGSAYAIKRERAATGIAMGSLELGTPEMRKAAMKAARKRGLAPHFERMIQNGWVADVKGETQTTGGGNGAAQGQ